MFYFFSIVCIYNIFYIKKEKIDPKDKDEIQDQ